MTCDSVFSIILHVPQLQSYIEMTQIVHSTKQWPQQPHPNQISMFAVSAYYIKT